MEKQKVDFYSTNIYTIPDSFFVDNNIKNVVTDLDNTLDGCDVSSPRKEALELKERLDKLNIKLYVISNNHEKRVLPYCEALNVEFLANAKKHTVKRIKNWLLNKNININETIFIGDQIFTDRNYVKKVNGKFILTYPLVKKDQFFTKFVRWLDNIIRKRWLKKGLLGQKIG